MRHIVPILAFAASLLGADSLDAQTPVSPELGARLRAAAEERQAALADPAADLLAARLAAATPLDAQALDDLVAPVALYPDALLAQVLAAAAYPDQIERAGDLIAAGDAMTDAELDAALAAEDWDPSVLALLSGFPTVVARMADDIDWTTRLGGAMLHQDGDVLAAVQRMRLRAEEAGNLQTNAAQVVERTSDVVAIRPADPDRIYVPDYDPGTVYVSSRDPAPYVATPYAAPQPQGGDLTTAIVTGAVGFGAGYLLSEMLDDDGDHGQGWNDYWRRRDVIDWRGRRFYPYPRRGLPASAWNVERDRHWDPRTGRWRIDEAARRRDAAERRALAPWIVDPGRPQLSEAEERRMRAWRQRAREQAREERRRDEARDERWRERRREQAREERARAERQAREERRADERKADERKAEERRADERRAAKRQDERRRDERAAADRRAEQARAARAERAQAEKAAAERAEARQARAARAERAQAEKAAAEKAEARQARAAREREARANREEARPRPEAVPEPARKAQAQSDEPTRKPAAKKEPRRETPQRAESRKPAEAKAASGRRDEPRRANERKKCKPNDERKVCRG